MLDDFSAKYPDLPIDSTELMTYLRGMPIPDRRKKEIWLDYCRATGFPVTRDDFDYILDRS